MKNKYPIIILLVISLVFFYKTFALFKVPFPGDILIADYFPFKYESYLGYNPGSYPNKAQYFDVMRQMYPWKMFAVAQIKSGQFPLWNPYNFSGMPLFANNQSAVLNPFNLLFFVMSPPVAWSLFIYFQSLLASVFAYLYLKKLKLSVISSLIGSVTYAYCLFMTVFIEYGNFGYSILYLPLLLFLIEKVFENRKTISGPLISIVIAVIAFSGHLQLFGGVVLFCLIYAVVRYFVWHEHEKKNLLVIILYFSLGIGISMIQLMPTTELIGNSARVPHAVDTFQKNILFQLQQLILFFAPDAYGNPAVGSYLLQDSYPGNAIYVGIIPLVFAFYAIFRILKNKYITCFTICSLILLLLITNNPIANFVYSLNIPYLSSSAPSNYIFILSFSLSALCAFGIDAWSRKFDKKIFISIVVALIIFSLFFAINKVTHIEVISKQILLSLVFIFVSILGIVVVFIAKQKRFIYILLVILVADLFYYFIKFNPFVPASTIFPETPLINFLKTNNSTRVWGYSAANMESNFQTYYGIYSPEGYDPLYPMWYGKFIYSSRNGKLLSSFSDSTRSDALIENGYGEKDLRENNLRLTLLDKTGVGLILNRPEGATTEYTFDPKRFEKVYDNDSFTVYKNKDAKPRAYLTTDYQTYSSDAEFEKKFYNSSGLLLEKSPPIPITKFREGSVKIVSQSATRIVLYSKSPSNTLLVLLDTYYPGWTAKVDGVSTEILRANYTFRAIPVRTGTHTIIFSYQPKSFYWGLIITIISSIAVALSYLYFKKQTK